MNLTIGSLFSGIGGMEKGLLAAGLGPVKWQVEIDPFCRAVLERHNPDARRLIDVRKCGRRNLDHVGIVCGGPPCQDISKAGPKTGIWGARSCLWFEMLRIICELRPQWVVVENSAALLVRGGAEILRGFAESGYDAFWRVIPAYELGAPHERERLYIIAHSNQVHGETWLGDFSYYAEAILKKHQGQCSPIWMETADQFIGVDDGIRGRVYRYRAGAVGNAVVPQITRMIGEMIMAFEGQVEET
ncbi:DNA cytosine methyltransferase [bacterium]|nr:DNA cytosine methyltransferase [bacterium]